MVSDDVILEQVENQYDPAGNVILTITRQRYHNAPANQTGPLNDPSTTPKARVTYVAFYHDPIGRIIATADYGTNGGVALTRPPLIPASSDTVLVTRTKYDRAGNVSEVTDPSGMVTMYEHDAARRKTKVIENYQATSSSSSSSSSGGCEPSDDANRTTRFTYTPDGQQATLVAENPRTGDQTTTWTYGTTLADSDIASSQLLRSVAYPDSTGESDTVRYTYNRQSERTTLTDQRGCVHTYDRDKLGRVLHDRVSTLGSGVDGAIRRLSTTYDVRGLTSKLTSWNNASVNSGNVVNECFLVYNNFRQLITDYQSHSGAVNTSTTPKVQYDYADGSTNTIRPITLTYPNGRIITSDYGTANGINDAASRIASLIDDDNTHLVDYNFLGLGIIVVVDYTEPDVKYTLVDLSGSNDPDTGDIYAGLDRFSRVKDCRWYDYGHTTDTVRLKYGYDRASNRLWRADLVGQSLSKYFDELYSYDGLHRLKDMQRGLLNGSETAVTNQNFGQCWSLDPTSNWHGFKEAATGGSWTLDQSRSANEVNEITNITNSTGPTWATPAYDPAGNTTTIPQPADPTESCTGNYDAWNRLVRLEEQLLTPLPLLVKVSENQYDARNFRTVRKDYTLGVLATTRHFYYTSGWQGIEERLGTSPDGADAERQFVWGRRYIDDLVLRDRNMDDDGTLDERLYGLQDANWNIVALIDTSAIGQERYLYSPFGWPIILGGSMSNVRTDSAIDNGVLFTGQRFDAATKLHLFRLRWFDSNSGRFLARDPLKYPDGPNVYAGWFANKGVDPLGVACNCGTEAGPQLHSLLLDTRVQMRTLKFWDLVKVCDSMLSASGWEGSTQMMLAGGGSAGFGTRNVNGQNDSFVDKANGCGVGECAGTVQINGDCYWAAEVNYVVWGQARRVCHDKVRDHSNIFDRFTNTVLVTPLLGDSLDSAITYMRIFRTAAHLNRAFYDESDPLRRDPGLGMQGRAAWIRAGWNGWDLSKPGPREARRDARCRKCPTNYKGSLTGYLGTDSTAVSISGNAPVRAVMPNLYGEEVRNIIKAINPNPLIPY